MRGAADARQDAKGVAELRVELLEAQASLELDTWICADLDEERREVAPADDADDEIEVELEEGENRERWARALCRLVMWESRMCMAWLKHRFM